MTLPRSVCVAVLSALSLCAAHLVATSPRQAQVATERPAGPTVDFGVVQPDGTPVNNLLASEVEIKVSDRVRRVRSLRRVSTARGSSASVAPAMLPAPYGTNDGVATGRNFILLVDQESFSVGTEPILRSAVQGLVAEFVPGDRAMVVTLPLGGVRLPFTSDTARIRLAMERLTGQGSRSETGSDMACRTRMFLESLEHFLQTQPTRSSPSTVVLFTAGMAGPRRDAPITLAPGMCELMINQFQRLSAIAGAARANFYVLQPADSAIGTGVQRESIAGGNFLGSDNPSEGIEHFAGVTGAVRLSLDATGTAALLRVSRETSAYFEAELEPEPGEVLGRSRVVSVSVARRGVVVRARPEVTFPEPTRRTGGPRLTITDLLASNDSASDLRLRVGAFPVREQDGRMRVGVLVEPEEMLLLDSVGALLIAEDGQIEGRWFSKDPNERPLMGAIAALPGTYRLRVAAIDATGRPGMAEEIVKVGVTQVGPLSLGSLMFGVSRDDTMRLQLEFRAEPAAIASFDIYATVSNIGLSAWLEVGRTVDGPPIVRLPLALARADATRVTARGAVPLGALPAGDYVVRGIVRLEDGTTGQITRTLRKVAK